MDPERWQRIDGLFQAILDAPTERRQLLAGETDPEVRHEVLAMLEAFGDDASADRRLGAVVAAGLGWDDDAAVGPAQEQRAAPARAPRRVGPYRVVREIGRGGLATVYLAERADHEFTQQVAVKLIRGGLGNEEILARLRLERQILANLDHPHIARLFDGGTTEDGRPYFVMEAIAGEHIDRWCDHRRLPLAERLDLLRKVCAAVDYAHRNLVLHRDIKPSNLLVTRDGTPKLLDFGIAKVLDPDDDGNGTAGTLDMPILTRAGDRVLTPEFASPEQLRGEVLTTASDVYSLGVLAYLLVSGRHPYAFASRRLAEIERVVCEVEPAPPSAVVRRARRDGEAMPGPWPGPARGEDLDRIVLMALDKKPSRRYASASELAEDLRRFAADLPVLARRDTFSYRARKFVRRYRLAVTAATLVLATLLVAVVATSWQAGVARAERSRAEVERQRAREVASFLTELFEVSDPYLSPGETVTARRLLDEGARRIRGELDASPLLRAELMTTMGRAYQGLALFAETEALLAEAVAIRRRQGEAAALARSLRDLGFLRYEQEDFEAARELLGEALELQQALPRPDAGELAHTLHYLAKAEVGRGADTVAEALFDRSLELYRTTADDPEGLLETLDSYAQLWNKRQDPRRAEEILRQVYEEGRRRLGDQHPRVTDSLNNLAVALYAGGDLAGAEVLFRRLLEVNRRTFGERHRAVALTLHNLATVFESGGRAEEALELLAEALEIDREVYGDEHTAAARNFHAQARAHRRLGALDEADRLLAEALEIDRRALGIDHPTVLRHLDLRARLARERGDAALAENLLRELLGTMRRTMPAQDNRLSYPLHTLGLVYLDRGDIAGASALLREALEIRRGVLGHEHPQVRALAADLERCRQPSAESR